MIDNRSGSTITKRSSSYRLSIAAACILGFAALLSACDNTVDPFAPGGGHPFTVFGYLDTAADTQFVRVSRLVPDPSGFRDVDDPPSVSTTNLTSGETAVWADSVVELEDGSRGVVYFASFDVQPSTRYRLDVADDGVEPTSGFTTVPGTPGILTGTPIENRFGDLEQTIFWSSIARARNANVHYRVRTLPSRFDTTIVISYPGLGERLPEGWAFSVTLGRDFRLVRRFVESANDDSTIALIDVSMSIEAPSEEWSETGESSNIENGSGFFASVGRFRESWSLDSTTVRSLGYEVP